jgi:hypothetical protein
MLVDCSLFGIVSESDGDTIRRIVVDYPTQQRVNQHFSRIVESNRILSKDRVLFDGRYKPETDEVLVIEDYNIEAGIIEAVQSPIAENTIDNAAIDVPNVKSVFIGDTIDGELIIVMQLIQKSQHLTSEGVKLFQRGGTFETVGESGFTLTEKIDAVYTRNSLIFSSYFFARQIFDLGEYYRIATNHDVDEFVNDAVIEVEDAEVFAENTDSWVRRKIALIKDSRVMELNTVSAICEIAGGCNISIPTRQDGEVTKIVMPNAKKELKEVLKFLDEDIYKGPLTNKTYETNSKLVKG